MIDAGLLTCLVCVCAAEMSLPWRMSGLYLRERVRRLSLSEEVQSRADIPPHQME